jgi:YVTN family beta-propeller protein
MRITAAVLLGVLAAAPVAAQETLIVLNKSDHTASLIDVKTGKSRATVPTGHGPHEAETLKGGKLVAVADYGTGPQPGGTVTLIDIAKGEVAGKIDVGTGARPHGLAAMPNGRLLVTAEGRKELLVVDPDAKSVLARIPTEQNVSHMVAVTPDSKRAFVANIGSGSVTAVDLEAGKTIKSIPTAAGAEGIAITPDGREVWITNREADTVSVLDAKSLEVVATIPAADFPIRTKITPDGKKALVSCAQSGDVAVFDVPSRKLLGRIAIDKEAVPGSEERLFSTQFGKSPVPVGLLIAPDGKRAWVASTNADVVSLLDIDGLKVVGRVTAGKEPDGLAGRF